MKTMNWFEWIQFSKSNRIFLLADDFFQNDPLLKEIKVDQSIFISAKTAKSLSTVEYVWNQLLENQFTKHDFLVGVGGGSITDLTTFIAGTYKRGIPHILVPTTLLAATDAAIGGKGGIDFGNFKNAVGVIKSPEFLVIYPQFFEQLGIEETTFGWAEVAKHALIGSFDLYQELSANKFQNVEFLVSKSVEFKNSVVSEDLYEQGRRKILNFGHTLGHALESYQLESNSPYSHGKCVVLGMLKELEIMYKIGSISHYQKDDITQWLHHLFPLENLPNTPWLEVLPYVKNDKKNEGNLIGFVEFCDVGKVEPEMKLSLQTVKELLS